MMISRISLILIFWIYIVMIALLFVSCGQARSSQGARVEILTAPDGARCYAIVQGDEVRAGGCVQKSRQ